MTIVKMTRLTMYRALVLALCFCMLPAFVSGENDKDKDKKKPAATVKAKPAPAPKATNTPVQHPSSNTPQPQPAPNHGRTGSGITSQNLKTPNTPGQQQHGITGQNLQNPNTPGQQQSGITGHNLQNSNLGRTVPSRPVYVPGPNVKTTVNADGTHMHYNPQTQMAIHTDKSGHIATMERPGLKATNYREDGHAAHIEHSRADGSKMVVDRVRVVTMGKRGFVERPIRKGYVSRTYVVSGRTEVRVYRTYTYGSVHYYRYVPRVYYQSAFYGWAYHPWGMPVAYAWGWGPAPWFFGDYFAPEPVYPTAALWLTDFLLAENLKLAYENRMAASGGGPEQQQPLAQNNSVTLTPEVKQMIAEEVQQQLAAEQAAAIQTSLQPSGAAPQSTVPDALPPALDPKTKIFVVSTSMNMSSPSDGQTCALTEGDIIERTSRNITEGKVPVTVLNSKEGDCPVDFVTAIDVSVLQDMHNQFREQISAGMEKLASSQGKAGLPVGPVANPQQVAEGQAKEAADAKDLLTMQLSEADKTEAEASVSSFAQ